MQSLDGSSILRQSTFGSSASNDPFSSNIDDENAEQDEENENDDDDETEGSDSDSDSDSNESEGEGPKDRSNAQDACKCKSCGKGYPDRTKLTKHKREHFSGWCEHCNKSFTTASGLRQHFRRKHKDLEPLTCPAKDCNYSNKIEHRVRDHIKRKHPKLAPEFSEIGSIKEYQNRKHEEDDVNLCPYCGLTFANAHDLMSHMCIHEAEAESLLCPAADCKSSCLTKTSLMKHISTYHPRFDVAQGGKGPVPKRHICEQCNKAFQSPWLLGQHKNIHLIERERFSCPVADCNCSYARKDGLKKHIESKHPDVEIEKRPSTS